MEKYKTIADVFIHNFETLNEWRELINVPHRLPDAVKYFIAQQLSDDQAIARLMPEPPEYCIWDILAFTDHSVLVPPDEIYEDEATYNHVVYCGGILEQISDIETSLDQLPKITNVTAFFNKSAEILKSLGVLNIRKSDFVSATIAGLTNDLDAALFIKFRRSPVQWEISQRLRPILEQANACGVLLKQCSELATRVPQSRKSKRSEAGPHAPRSRRTGVALKRRAVMQNISPKIQFWLDRERHVIPCEFSHLVEAFNSQSMTPLGVKQYCGSVQILFSGYGSETRLPFVIPEIRKFSRALRQAWLFAPFFCDLDNSFLSIEAMAHVERFSVFERKGSKEFYLQIHTAELRRYVRESHHVIQRLGRYAGMSSEIIRTRLAQFDSYIRERLGPAE